MKVLSRTKVKSVNKKMTHKISMQAINIKVDYTVQKKLLMPKNCFFCKN